ncbi:MAG TPA: RNA-binding protein [Symbiobacteriaceae bacterium]|nr:RNA-binding protein [Symbiobacteriaceae bacterium]
MRALNFYSSVYHGFLVSRDKTCTIRLGDKSYKYQDGDVVLVTYGDKFKPRKKVFTAVIDQVKLKKIGDLSVEDLQGENPEMQTPQDAVEFLNLIYRSEITLDSLVTVVHFSEIVE